MGFIMGIKKRLTGLTKEEEGLVGNPELSNLGDLEGFNPAVVIVNEIHYHL